MDIKKRNTNIDLIRIFALFCVIATHFYLNTEFYNTPIVGKNICFLTFIKSSFLICVPLFLLITGYLMNKRQLNKNHYKSITKIIVIYIIVSILNYFHTCFFTNDPVSFKNLILKTLGFSAAKYSWYVEMYIGLFILIPFFNILINNLPNQKCEKWLLISMIALTALPTIFNIYNFSEPGWFSNPTLTHKTDKLLPFWWFDLYPITYYFIGAYISRHYKKDIKTYKLLIPLVITSILLGSFDLYRNYSHVYMGGYYQEFYSLFIMILSVTVFLIILNINTDKLNDKIKYFISMIGKISFGAYLISSIFDDLIYNYFSKIFSSVLHIKYFPLCVFSVLILSLLASFFIDYIYDLIVKAFKKTD